LRKNQNLVLRREHYQLGCRSPWSLRMEGLTQGFRFLQEEEHRRFPMK
jgi:hypothetical protein